VRPESADALSMSRIFSLDTKDVALVCLCYVANPTSAQIRYAIRRLRRKAPKAFILVSMMGGADDTSRAEAARACQADDVRQSLTETIDQIKDLARGVQGANDASSDTLVSKAG
jgi:tRNA A37 methylthiotransferase MiaB